MRRTRDATVGARRHNYHDTDYVQNSIVNLLLPLQPQTDVPIPIFMQFIILAPPRFHTPSTSITIPLSLPISPSPIFYCTLQDLQRLGLWGSRTIHAATTKRGHYHMALLKARHTKTLHHIRYSCTSKYIKSNNNK